MFDNDLSYGSGSDFPYIKFIILSVFFIIPILWFTPGMKWKITYALAVPVGIALALMGKSMRGRK